MGMFGHAARRRLGAVACLAAVLVLPADLSGRDASTLSSVVKHGPTGLRRIALTFDSNMTDAMLRWLDTGKVQSDANVGVIDELQRSRTPATFFLTGEWVEHYRDLTRRIAADPSFELASHSYANLVFATPCYGLPAGLGCFRSSRRRFADSR